MWGSLWAPGGSWVYSKCYGSRRGRFPNMPEAVLAAGDSEKSKTHFVL